MGTTSVFFFYFKTVQELLTEGTANAYEILLYNYRKSWHPRIKNNRRYESLGTTSQLIMNYHKLFFCKETVYVTSNYNCAVGVIT